MKKLFLMVLALVTLFSAVCSAEVQKSYDDRNSRAIIRTLKFIPAAELDPDSTICINMKKIYFFDSRFYDNAVGRYNPRLYFTVALIGNAAEKFANTLTCTAGRSSFELPLSVEAKQNEKKQTVLASGTCEFKNPSPQEPFLKALQQGNPMKLEVVLKSKRHDVLRCSLEGKLLEELQEVAAYDIYDDANFLNMAAKANQRPKY